MGTKRSSASDKAQHASYKTEMRWAKNRKIKLERALKKNPQNLEIAAAIKNVSYRRATPTTKEWSHSNKAFAQVVKNFCGKCDKNIFSGNKDLIAGAWAGINAKMRSRINTNTHSRKEHIFSIKNRAHNKGELVWAT